MRKIINHINTLIDQYDYVIIPGFGGFVSNYESAWIHPVQHTMSPPSKSIAFNRNLTNNDGLLVNHISKKEQIPSREAKDKVRSFARHCEEQLKEREMLILGGIGKIFLDIEKKLQFIQDTSSNHLLNAYGLPTIKTAPVLRRELVSTHVDTPQDGDEEPSRQINYWWVSIAALFVMLFGLLTWAFIDNKLDIQTSEIFGFLKKEGKTSSSPEVEGLIHWESITSLTFSPVTPLKEPSREAATLPEDEFEQPTTAIINGNIPSGYYVIIGSFVNEANAIDLNSRLQREGLRSYRIPADNGFIRVGVYISSEKEEVIDDLAQLRDQYEVNAWMLHNK